MNYRDYPLNCKRSSKSGNEAFYKPLSSNNVSVIPLTVSLENKIPFIWS